MQLLNKFFHRWVNYLLHLTANNCFIFHRSLNIFFFSLLLDDQQQQPLFSAHNHQHNLHNQQQLSASPYHTHTLPTRAGIPTTVNLDAALDSGTLRRRDPSPVTGSRGTSPGGSKLTTWSNLGSGCGSKLRISGSETKENKDQEEEENNNNNATQVGTPQGGATGQDSCKSRSTSDLQGNNQHSQQNMASPLQGGGVIESPSGNTTSSESNKLVNTFMRNRDLSWEGANSPGIFTSSQSQDYNIFY